MICWPTNAGDIEWCQEFLRLRGDIHVNATSHFLVWQSEGKTKWVVAYDSWVGKTAQIHMASWKTEAPPRDLIRAVFHYAFKVLKLKCLYGMVNSLNQRAMRLDGWLGFREVYRAIDCHDHGGDIVCFEMTPADCRWLRKVEHGQEKRSTTAGLRATSC